MTQEDKQLLLKDLAARLPYGVIVVDHYGFVVLFTWKQMKDFEDDYISKPYLRPMSDMTEEEMKIRKDYIYHFSNYSLPNYEGDFVFEDEAHEYIDWLNSHHFDYRGLILKGLAIAVTEENNPYKQ